MYAFGSCKYKPNLSSSVKGLPKYIPINPLLRHILLQSRNVWHMHVRILFWPDCAWAIMCSWCSAAGSKKKFCQLPGLFFWIQFPEAICANVNKFAWVKILKNDWCSWRWPLVLETTKQQKNIDRPNFQNQEKTHCSTFCMSWNIFVTDDFFYQWMPFWTCQFL